jgi:hypothetical protein
MSCGSRYKDTEKAPPQQVGKDRQVKARLDVSKSWAEPMAMATVEMSTELSGDICTSRCDQRQARLNRRQLHCGYIAMAPATG